MTCAVEFTDTAEDDLSRLDTRVAQRVLDRLRWMADNAESVRHRALTGPLQGVFSLRIGDYRALYTYERATQRVVVHVVRHRSQVYRPR